VLCGALFVVSVLDLLTVYLGLTCCTEVNIVFATIVGTAIAVTTLQ